MAEFTPGSAFAEHVIREIVGRGGMGVVYHALHLPLNRDVALKVIAPQLSADPAFRARFRRESVAAASIRHANVIPIYDAGERDGHLYLTMQFVSGLDLGRIVAAEGRLPPAQAAAVVAQVAAALDAAHAADLVHRDVKPANVLIEWHGDAMHAYLTDFGLAKSPHADSRITQAGGVLGTPDYAAPEQLQEAEVDARADVYSLGCVLYHAVTGEVPYPGSTAAAKVQAHLREHPPAITDLVPEAPPALADVVSRALEQDPRDRYASAGELGRAARAACGEDLTPTVRVTAGRRPAVAAAPVTFPPALEHEAGASPFVGRRELIARVRRRYEAAGAGAPQFVLLCGEPGIGKTRLAAEVAVGAHAEGATVLYGRSDRESLVPYQPFIAALDHYLGHHRTGDLAFELGPELSEVARYLPGLERLVPAVPQPAVGDPEAARYRLFTAVARLVAFIAARRPALLILDDLQWADTPTALLLRHAVYEADPSRLLLIGTLRTGESCRSDAMADLLARLRTQPSFERISLAGLDESETAALVEASSGRNASAGFVRRLQDKTNGNPLFIGELLRGLAETQAGGETVSERALRRMGVPEGAKEMIARRLQRLSGLAQELLAVAAVVGTTFSVDIVERLLPAPEELVMGALEEARAAGLVREDQEDLFAFSHAVVHESLSEQFSESRRARLHRRIGEALEASGSATPAELAHHFFASRRLDAGAKAFTYELQAGDSAAASLAHEAAAAHYRRALEALDMGRAPDARRRCDVLLALGRVELRAGDPQSRSTFAQAAALARAESSPEQLARAALGFSGLYSEAGIVDHAAITLLEEALTALGDGDSALHARVLARLADRLHFAPDDGRTAALSQAAVAMAERTGDTQAIVEALESTHGARLHIQHLDERLRLSAVLLALAERTGDRELKALGHHWRIYDLLEAADIDAAKREHRALTELARSLRQPLYEHFAIGWEVVWAQMAGRVEEAERLAMESYELGKRAQARDAETVFRAQEMALRRREDRLSEFVSTVERAIENQPALSPWRAVLPLAHAAAGEREAALAEFEALARDDFAGVPRDMFWFPAMCVLAEACSVLGDRARAAALYGHLLPYRDRFVQVTQAACWGSAERFLGLLATALGRWDDACAHFESALAKNAAAGIRPLVLLIRRDYAQMLAARGRPDDLERAAKLLRETLAAAEAAGMSIVAARLREGVAAIERRIGAAAAPR